MAMGTAVIIGANRGIGLEFVKQHLEEDFDVIATYRRDGAQEQLQALQQQYPGKLTLSKFDITDINGVKMFAVCLKTVDVLILNAGIKGYEGRGVLPPDHGDEQLERALAVNIVAHDNLIRALAPKILARPNTQVVYMGSLVGLTSQNTSGGSHVYRIAKAASEMMIRNWDLYFRSEWAKNHPAETSPRAITLCAGWVKTDMGGPDARLEVDESVSQMMNVMRRVKQRELPDGLYLYNGTVPSTYAQPDFLKKKTSALFPAIAFCVAVAAALAFTRGFKK
jgi:NAD(P)-dependent dehydrogenase (short-subunit alcohol dehydrogenase family)